MSATNLPLLNRALALEVDPMRPTEPDRPVLYVGEHVVSTSGNLTALTGRAKTAKTAVVAAIAGACAAADGGRGDADTLGIASSPPGGRAVVWLDTEQSPARAAANLSQALARVGLEPREKPAWLRQFPLAGWSARELCAVLPPILDRCADDHGGIHVVLVDGGADFALDVNGAEEAAALCAGWHSLAIRYRCALAVVVHSNEGSTADSTARGWLGKQLRRKAESNLLLRRSGDTVTLFAEDCQRHAPIPESDGPRFRWDPTLGRHTLVEVRSPTDCDALRLLAEEVFQDGQGRRYGEVLVGIKTTAKCAERTAEAKFAAMSKSRILVKGLGGRWNLAA